MVSTLSVAGATRFVTGRVTDAVTGEPVEFASIALKPGQAWTSTDAEGRFSIERPANVTNSSLTISFVGYKPLTVKLDDTITDRSLTIKLTPLNRSLGEVVVTAHESNGMTSSSRIDRDAMSHLQPTSFTDILELLPGNISQTPNMGSVNAITLRETGTLSATGAKSTNEDYNITSLGTLFVVDGAPMMTDANLQSVPGSSASSGDLSSGKSMTNRGIDMRSISTDNIESVEIVRGIPSAEYGNLTSGMVNIKRIRRATPMTARLKIDEYSKLFSVGKGIYLGRQTNNVVNIDAGWLDSKVDPRNSLENYKRANISARFHLDFKLRGGLSLKWAPGVDYNGSFDDTKTDPDLSYLKVNDYKASYNKFDFTSELRLEINRPWIKEAGLNMSVSYQRDRLE
ncbi:MAG: TonB-dependent receptor, partial [Muribaculaceae bacterium]|nr:TonB-dependent receptor [Muribaculaceae bacterium]